MISYTLSIKWEIDSGVGAGIRLSGSVGRDQFRKLTLLAFAGGACTAPYDALGRRAIAPYHPLGTPHPTMLWVNAPFGGHCRSVVGAVRAPPADIN
jgi:hypothetical protein